MKKKRKSDLNTARVHFQNAVKEWIVGSAYMAKGMREVTKNNEGSHKKQGLQKTDVRVLKVFF